MAIFSINNPGENMIWDVLEIRQVDQEYYYTQFMFLVAPSGETTPTKMFRLVTQHEGLEDIPDPE